jgi:methanol metabolism-related c-type cytochrome
MTRNASKFLATATLAAALPVTVAAQNWSDQPVDPAAHEGEFTVAFEDDGRYFNADDTPTFQIDEDGTVDWLTFSGFRRYHAECHVCHGPDGAGSSIAPKIANSAINMGYYDFVDVVVNGRINGNSVMPHFGTNQNVMCYLDDIYVYLAARGMEAVPRGRPALKDAKSESIREQEDVCMQ